MVAFEDEYAEDLFRAMAAEQRRLQEPFQRMKELAARGERKRYKRRAEKCHE